MRELDAGIVARLVSPEHLARCHILPTKNNQDLLRREKKVILLRDPVEVLLSYRRSLKAGLHKQSPIDFKHCPDDDAAWLARARSIGLLTDLEDFVQRWEQHDGDKLVLFNHQIVEQPAESISAIESYFGLPASGVTQLRKDNYARSKARARVYILAKTVSQSSRLRRALELSGVYGPARWIYRRWL